MGRSRASLATVLALVACSDATGPGASGPITELPRPVSAAEQEVQAGSNTLAFELVDELLPEAPDENLFWSPLSASMLLAMVLNGADGDTYAQIKDVLDVGRLSQNQINQGYRDLVDLLVNLDPAVTVEIGNSTWTASRFSVLADYRRRIEAAFRAEAREVGFGDPATLDAINGWVADATHGRIETIFDELPANVLMVLLNAVYFQADWTHPFEKARTEAAPFTRPDGSTVTADLMYLEEELPVIGTKDMAMVDIPYAGEAFAMAVVLPAPDRTVADVLTKLWAGTWPWYEALWRTHHTILRLPRFELGWEANLNDPLGALGMTDAFDPVAADFSRLTPGGGVSLSLVKQKAWVKVDEEGTTAAAATGGFIEDAGPAVITVDRPFLFLIRERLTGTILFMGVVNDPTR